MLIVRAHNVFTDHKDMADYDVAVLINQTPIWVGRIEEHYRPDGAETLLERIATQMREERKIP